MKRDMDLIRDLLLRIEETPANAHPDDIAVEGYDEAAINEHLEMLIQDGFVAGKVNYSGMGDERIYLVVVKRLTWKGHDFVDTIRNDTVWKNTKRTILEKGGAMSLEIVSAIAAGFAKQLLGLPPG